MAKRVVDDASLKAIADKMREIDVAGEIEFPNGFVSGIEDCFQHGKTLGISEGYDNGLADGIEQGKKAEHDQFWDVFQNYGEEQHYINAFSYGRFNEQTYNPKYPINVLASTTGLDQAFYQCGLTDTKVPIYASGAKRLNQTFYNSQTLQTIRLLQLSPTCTFTNAFHACIGLVDITIDGEIGQNGFDLSGCINLSKASFESVISHLSTTTSGLSVTFRNSAKNKVFTDEEWAALVATRPNWTINLT